MNTRKGIGKRLRFSIFARDGFTCRYCGRQSDQVVLQVDHVIPVSKGGTNDEANLVTSCIECNQGKSDKSISQAAPNETDRLRMIQELREQELAAQSAANATKARESLKNSVLTYFCEARGTDRMDKTTLNILTRFVAEHGSDLVFHWIDVACARMFDQPDERVGAYICGIRKNMKEEQCR